MKNILIIFPFADFNPVEGREEQLAKILEELVVLIGRIRNGKNRWFLMVSEQVEPRKYFNRGQVLNIAVKYFIENVGNPDSVIFHDIDIIPNVTLFREYSKYKDSYSLMPFRSKNFKKTYGFKLFAGSAIYLTKPDIFINANGYPNNYWGWGGEDNALDKRLKNNRVKLQHNTKGEFTSTDKQRANNKEKLKYLKKEKVRNMMVYELQDTDKKQWRNNGYGQLNNLNYQILEEVVIDKGDYTKIHIKLKLDETDLELTIRHNEKIYGSM